MSRKSRYPFEASVYGLIAQACLVCREHGIPVNERREEHRFHPTRKWRFDLAFPVIKIGLEYHGGLFMPRKGGHQTVRGTRNDWEKLNEAQLLGWIVLQFGPDEIRTGSAMQFIERAIRLRLE